MGTQLNFFLNNYSQFDFYQNNDLIKNIGAHCKITRGPEIFTWAQGVLLFPVPKNYTLTPGISQGVQSGIKTASVFIKKIRNAFSIMFNH